MRYYIETMPRAKPLRTALLIGWYIASPPAAFYGFLIVVLGLQLTNIASSRSYDPGHRFAGSGRAILGWWSPRILTGKQAIITFLRGVEICRRLMELRKSLEY
jgi:hypothetical protein